MHRGPRKRRQQVFSNVVDEILRSIYILLLISYDGAHPEVASPVVVLRD